MLLHTIFHSQERGCCNDQIVNWMTWLLFTNLDWWLVSLGCFSYNQVICKNYVIRTAFQENAPLVLIQNWKISVENRGILLWFYCCYHKWLLTLRPLQPKGCHYLCLPLCLSVPIILVNMITLSVYPINAPNLQGGFDMSLSWMVLWMSHIGQSLHAHSGQNLCQLG